MRVLTLLFIGIILSGCSNGAPDRNQDFNYYRLVQALELDKVFPGRYENTKKELQNNCLTNGEMRVTTHTGLNDEVRYVQCDYTPYPLNEPPIRLQNR